MPALRPRAAALRRVGHKGADLIEPGNTRESFDAALSHGVDMIEFDVLPALGSDGRPDPAAASCCSRTTTATRTRARR